MDLSGAVWRKSSFSGSNGNSGCVEVAAVPAGAVAVRDTKDRTRAPHVYTCQEWAAFLLAVRSGEFDRP